MAVANYGVNVTITAEAARPIPVESLTPIGIAGEQTGLSNGLHFFVNVSDAIKKVQELNKEGSILRALEAIDAQAVETPILLSVFEKDTDGKDHDTTLTNAIGAIEEFKNAKAIFGYRPNLIIAPEYSGEDAIKGALESIAGKLKATAITDLNAVDVAGAKTAMGSYGSRRLLATFPKVKIYDKQSGGYVFAPQSARIAGMIAATDGYWEYGFSDSYSNRVMKGIYGTEIPIDFELGEGACSADMLRTAHISTIIRHEGYRTWGGETSDQDTIWQDLARVRIFDRISEACQKGVLFAIDKRADQLYHAKRSVDELLRSFVGSKVLLGFEISWSAKNTAANITAGKFYMDVRMQNNPIVKQLTLDFIYVDSYAAVLMDGLKK